MAILRRATAGRECLCCTEMFDLLGGRIVKDAGIRATVKLTHDRLRVEGEVKRQTQIVRDVAPSWCAGVRRGRSPGAVLIDKTKGL